MADAAAGDKRPAPSSSKSSSSRPAKRSRRSHSGANQPSPSSSAPPAARPHSAFFDPSDPVRAGLLVSVSARQEARGAAQFRGLLEHLLPLLVPDLKAREAKETDSAGQNVAKGDGTEDEVKENGQTGHLDAAEEAEKAQTEGQPNELTDAGDSKPPQTNQTAAGRQTVEMIDTGCQAVVFFNLRIPELDAVDLVARMFDHLRNLPAEERTKWSYKLAYCHRVIPVQAACEASRDAILAAAAPLAASLQDGRTYAVDLEVRNNNKVGKRETIDAAAALVGARCKVSLKNPEQSLLISVNRQAALLAAVPNYSELSGYNVHRVLGTKPREG
ncbi:hypothetical protein DFJ74DRAFT_693912 [Hyaloraphidium curvatum]|nr:hypothetical protein DFJ74DRAFT_693912 [Hyaloraphidium curvatum]